VSFGAEQHLIGKAGKTLLIVDDINGLLKHSRILNTRRGACDALNRP
jgi:hypothetical protein